MSLLRTLCTLLVDSERERVRGGQSYERKYCIVTQADAGARAVVLGVRIFDPGKLLQEPFRPVWQRNGTKAEGGLRIHESYFNAMPGKASTTDSYSSKM